MRIKDAINKLTGKHGKDIAEALGNMRPLYIYVYGATITQYDEITMEETEITPLQFLEMANNNISMIVALEDRNAFINQVQYIPEELRDESGWAGCVEIVAISPAAADGIMQVASAMIDADTGVTVKKYRYQGELTT